MKLFVLYLTLLSFSTITCISNILLERLNHIKPRATEEDQSHAVILLIKRLIPNHSSSFAIIVSKDTFHLQDGIDAFEISSLQDGRIQITGTTGVAAASGLYYYLKYWCGCSVSWSGDQLKLPDVLPKVDKPVRQEFHERFRYYQNVCTVSYSMAFWNWSRWEKEIDWMALNGINLPLAFTGQEGIWQIVYKELGLTQEELDTHFSGPAFFAWQRMGNLDLWGGPLPPSWYGQQLDIQNQILIRMRSFGMIPVLPGFAGHIPKPLVTRLYPNVKYYKLEGWCGFSAQYGTYLLDVQEPLFQKIGKMFIETQLRIYNGTDHVYNADVYNEMKPPVLTTAFMTLTSQNIFSAMISADSQAVWLMQAWMFLADYWTKPLMEAWFSAVPYGRLILLCVGSELEQLYVRTEGYYGYPFIWTMINNFGGSTRLYGQLQLVSTDIVKARATYKNNLIGLGATPEGINQNDINFELLNEMGWRNEPINVTDWGKLYAYRRYGGIDPLIEDAWSLLANSVYNQLQRSGNGGGTGGRPVVMMPYVVEKFDADLWYDPIKMRLAWNQLFRASVHFKDSITFRYDIVRLGAQALEDLSILIYQKMMNAYYNNSLDDFIIYSQYFVELTNDMDSILSTEQHSLLGSWIESARQYGQTDDEKNLLEFNARNQVSVWGHENILDYANKQWAGLLKDYYKPRWIMFNNVILDCMQNKKPFNQDEFNHMVWNVSDAWNESHNPYPSQPVGDWYTETARLIAKYGYFEIDHNIDGGGFWKDIVNNAKNHKTNVTNRFTGKFFA